MSSKVLIEKLTTVCEYFQKPQASDASDAKKRRRVEELPSKGGLIEVLDNGDPRKSQKPVVEYVCPASILPVSLSFQVSLPSKAWARTRTIL
jgi:hypothetical protein